MFVRVDADADADDDEPVCRWDLIYLTELGGLCDIGLQQSNLVRDTDSPAACKTQARCWTVVKEEADIGF